MPNVAALATLAALTTGCLFVPKTMTATQVVERGSTEKSSALGPVVLETSARDATLQLRARHQRTCRRESFTVVETTEDQRLDMSVAGFNDARAAVIGVALAPITLTISGIISAIIIHNHDAKTSRERTVTSAEPYACPVAARTVVKVLLPSGASIDGQTNADGRYAFAIPASEVDHGVVTFAAGGRTAAVHYFRDHAACSAERAERYVRANAVGRAADRAYLLEQLPRCAAMTTTPTASVARERGWDLAIEGAIAAARGRCHDAARLHGTLATFDREWASALHQQPDVAWCTRNREIARVGGTRPASTATSRDAGRPERAGCLAQRGRALREAQAIADLQERGHALSRIPQCR